MVVAVAVGVAVLLGEPVRESTAVPLRNLAGDLAFACAVSEIATIAQ